MMKTYKSRYIWLIENNAVVTFSSAISLSRVAISNASLTSVRSLSVLIFSAASRASYEINMNSSLKIIQQINHTKNIR